MSCLLVSIGVKCEMATCGIRQGIGPEIMYWEDTDSYLVDKEFDPIFFTERPPFPSVGMQFHSGFEVGGESNAY